MKVSERAGGRVGPEFSSLTIVMGNYKIIKNKGVRSYENKRS